MDLVIEENDCCKNAETASSLDASQSEIPETLNFDPDATNTTSFHPQVSNEILDDKLNSMSEDKSLDLLASDEQEEENTGLTKESFVTIYSTSNREHQKTLTNCDNTKESHDNKDCNDGKESYDIKNSIKSDNIMENSESTVTKEKSNIYCSTPVVSTLGKKDNQIQGFDNDFGKMSPLTNVKSKKNLKRKNLGLECIKEIDEDALDSLVEKKPKLSETKTDLSSEAGCEQDVSSSVHCFEAPAKSILKKWQLSCLSRNTGSSCIVLDECGENDTEDGTKPNHDVGEPPLDDFEVACNSLTEELMKSTSNIETLQKYYSQVQLESQMDNDNFDLVLNELSLNCELDEKTSLSVKHIEESVLTGVDKTIIELDEVNNTNDSADLTDTSTIEADITVIEAKASLSTNNSESHVTENKQIDKTDQLENDSENSKISVQLKESIKNDSPSSSDIKKKLSILDRLGPEPAQTSNSEHRTIIFPDGGKDMTLDEEDVLLDEDISVKKKPYVFFEFVSSDPKENEDNYNPEWQKLGQLTSDGERYKAVRDRWRSLKPPDPNKDLTCRQWREINKKPPLNLPSRNNNHQMYMDSERNQLCTAVFEMKIKRMVQDLDNGRMKILRQRNREFEELALVQDQEQRMMAMRGGSGLDMSHLHKRHIEECRDLKLKHDLELNKITAITEEKIEILKAASEEVLLFQKFYKGVDASDDEVCMYMTDIQVQELMETEEMLEKYAQFYR